MLELALVGSQNCRGTPLPQHWGREPFSVSAQGPVASPTSLKVKASLKTLSISALHEQLYSSTIRVALT